MLKEIRLGLKENRRLQFVNDYISDVELGVRFFDPHYIKALRLRDHLNPFGMNIHARPLMVSAIEFAAIIHSGEVRRDSGVQYITHSLQTAEIVASVTQDENLHAAAVLHDTIENSIPGDTDPDNLEEIFIQKKEHLKKTFNERVSTYVGEVSFVFNKEVLSWQMRKQMTIFGISGMSMDALLIKSADAIANMNSFIRDRDRLGSGATQKFEHNLNKQLRYYNDMLYVFEDRWPRNPLLYRLNNSYSVMKHGSVFPSYII